jgi:hypothetical protein
MVMVAASRNECGLRTKLLHELEAEHAAIEIERALQVGDFQVDVPDADRWINGGGNGLDYGPRMSVGRRKAKPARSPAGC